MRHIYHIEGIDDNECAKRIEEYLLNDPLIAKVIVDFVGKKLFITYKEQEYPLEKLLDLIHNVDANISLNSDEQKVDKKEDQSLNKRENWMIIRLVIASVALAFGYFWKLSDTLRLIIFIASYLCAGYDVFIKLVKGIINKNFFNELTLIVIATIGAFIIKSYPEAALVMIIFQIGMLAKDASIEYAKKKLSIDHEQLEALDSSKAIPFKEVQISDKESKIKLGKIINKIVTYYIPVILVIFLFILLIPKIFELIWPNYAYSAFIILVASSSFSFVISASLARFVGHKTLAKQGVIINDLNKEDDDLCSFDFSYFDLEKIKIYSLDNDNENVVNFASSAFKKIQITAITGMIISLIIKLACYILAILGIVMMWIALLADIIATLLVILNTMMLENRIGVRK